MQKGHTETSVQPRPDKATSNLVEAFLVDSIYNANTRGIDVRKYCIVVRIMASDDDHW
jgi:hypothetical protein